MNILDVITKEDLMKPPDIRDDRNYGGYNLKSYFIKVHGRAMGGLGKPMIFDRNRVEAYLDGLFGKAEIERADRAEAIADTKKFIDQAVARVMTKATITTIGSGQMRGRGGRVRAV